jgi:hypothetical protein
MLSRHQPPGRQCTAVGEQAPILAQRGKQRRGHQRADARHRHQSLHRRTGIGNCLDLAIVADNALIEVTQFLNWKLRAQWWALPQASMAMQHRGGCAMKAR